MIEDEQKHFVLDAVNFSTWRTGVFVQLPFLASNLGMRLKPYLAQMVFGNHVEDMFRRFMKIATDMLAERAKRQQEKPSNRKDLLSFLQDYEDPQTRKKFTPAEPLAETRFLLVAGKF